MTEQFTFTFSITLKKKKKDPIFKVNFTYIFFIIFCDFFLMFYFGDSNCYSRFLIFAFWYLLSTLYL